MTAAWQTPWRALPLFFPEVEYVPRVPRKGAVAIRHLCALAQAPCSGQGGERLIVLLDAADREPWIRAEPGKNGVVEVGVPSVRDKVIRVRWALGALAFSRLFDSVSRAAVRGQAWARTEEA